MEVHPNDMHKLLAGFRVFHEGTGEVGGGGDGVLFLDAAHGHAHVLCFYDYSDTEWLEGVLDAVFNLLGEAFLNLKATCVGIDDTWYFAEANDLAIGDVGNVGFSDEGYEVVLAERVDFDVFDDDHLTVVFVEHGRP